jgi:hypothetical protein
VEALEHLQLLPVRVVDVGVGAEDLNQLNVGVPAWHALVHLHAGCADTEGGTFKDLPVANDQEVRDGQGHLLLGQLHKEVVAAAAAAAAAVTHG